MELNKVYLGDCLEKLKELEDNSVDAVVTDPPYGLSFMGKKWDYDVPSQEIWEECLRVLKPGGYLLAFAGTRTQHRMAVRIEDAGFEIRDMIAWVYGSGFPKSLNIGKAVNSLETNEWSKISKAFDNVDQKSIMEVWKTNAKLAGIKLVKNLTGVGSNTRRKYFVHDIAVLYFNQEKENASAITAELNLCVPSRTSEENLSIAVGSVEQNTELSQNLVKSVVKLSENQRAKSWNIFTAQCDVKEWLNENTEVNHKVDEALKTLRGNKKYSNEEIINVLCVALTDILKLTILNQSKTFQNLDTNQKMECVSAINVIITEYIMDNLISNTVAILKSKAVDKLQGNERIPAGRYTDPNGVEYKQTGHRKNFTAGNSGSVENCSDDRFLLTKGASEFEGWGTALKPALEPITVARKPLEKGLNVASNCLKWGVGGINIDECRVEYQATGEDPRLGGKGSWKPTRIPDGHTFSPNAIELETSSLGRFPANLIHDNSEEVRECFPETKSGKMGKQHTRHTDGSPNGIYGKFDINHELGETYGDSGNASRFFKSILYYPKASKSERNKGCEGLEAKANSGSYQFREDDSLDGKPTAPKTNSHPTVKPIALMEYLVKLVSREGAVVLDPFAGSGSTLIACKNLGRQYIGIEREEEYIKIIEARLYTKNNTLF